MSKYTEKIPASAVPEDISEKMDVATTAIRDLCREKLGHDNIIIMTCNQEQLEDPELDRISGIFAVCASPSFEMLCAERLSKKFVRSLMEASS